MRNLASLFHHMRKLACFLRFYSIWEETSLSVRFRTAERKQALIKVNSLSDGKERVPRIRGSKAATVLGAPKLDSSEIGGLSA